MRRRSAAFSLFSPAFRLPHEPIILSRGKVLFGWLPESFTIKCNVSQGWGPVSPEKQGIWSPTESHHGKCDLTDRKSGREKGCLMRVQ